jgi:hypothetical protein
MSEKIYACLLRLYPSRFREEYKQEAIQLYRDLSRQETGLLARTRLWVGLLADLALGLPQAYRNAYESAAASPIAQGMQGIPTFRLLEEPRVRPGSLLFGSVLSLAALTSFSLLLSHPAVYRAWSVSGGSRSPIEAVLERLNRPVPQGESGKASQQAGDSAPGDAGETGTQQAATPEAQSPTTAAQGATPEAQRVFTQAQNGIDAAERHRVIASVVRNLEAHYPSLQQSGQASTAILRNEQQGAYDGPVDGAVLARQLTADLQRATQDPHIAVVYSNLPLPTQKEPSVAALNEYRAAMKQLNCTFEKIEVLPHNVGYFKLNSFPDPAICGASADAAMDRLNGTNAIIFDLRENRGGFPEMVGQIGAWLFETPVAWYNPRAQSVSETRTHSPVHGSRFGREPVYVLTSSETASGAEQFAYNLKMLKRATLVGERTRGETHSGSFYRIDDHFGIGLPDKSIANPYGKPDWEGTGVNPDVRVKASDALEVAEKSACSGAQRK